MAKETEKTILEVARRTFVQRGFAAARMQEIADEAGTNKAMLHYYFRSKEKLYQEVIRYTLDTILPRFARALQAQGTVMERLEVIITEHIGTLRDNPDIPFFILSELSQKRESFLSEIEKRVSHFSNIQQFLAQIMQEMQEGKIRQIPPVQLLLNVMGMCVFPFLAKPIFCNVIKLPEENFDAIMAERKDFVIEFVRNALRPD